MLDRRLNHLLAQMINQLEQLHVTTIWQEQPQLVFYLQVHQHAYPVAHSQVWDYRVELLIEFPP